MPTISSTPFQFDSLAYFPPNKNQTEHFSLLGAAKMRRSPLHQILNQLMLHLQVADFVHKSTVGHQTHSQIPPVSLTV